ncbi:MAG: DUF362 domain-containing protein [Desulfovibrio sp.]
MDTQKHAVHLHRVTEYTEEAIRPHIENFLSNHSKSYGSYVGKSILVKPNLVAKSNVSLACTHPVVVTTTCKVLRDMGANVTVGDSPAFGSANHVAKGNGLQQALHKIDIPLISLDKPIPLHLSFGKDIGISSRALERDLVVNLPKFKAHIQFRITACVKNLFGCVSGFRKALAHTRFGPQSGMLEKVVVETMLALPETINILDGITAMHVTGPIKGQAYPMHMLGCCDHAPAMDTALYTLLKLTPEVVPVWPELLSRGISGTKANSLHFPDENLNRFDAKDFQLDNSLDPMEFEKVRFIRGRVKSLLSHFK